MTRILAAVMAFLLATAPAFAHLDPATHGSFMAGFTHPLFGLDHVLAMVAVGLWAATLGRGVALKVPLAFVGAMVLGFAAVFTGFALPFVEPVILASVVFIGVMLALALPVPAVGVAGLVGFFALFHGYAHGGELAGAGALEFAAGFVAATALLHGAGIGIGLAVQRLGTPLIGRVAGGVTALAGLWLATGA